MASTSAPANWCSPEPSALTGLILAGGAGRRMGGVDKGLQAFRGRPLVESVLEALRPQVGSLLISANRHRETYARYGCPVLADAQTVPAAAEPYAGPLAGMRAGLAACRSDWLLCVPCDTPFLPADLAARLCAAIAAAPGARLAVARVDGTRQPTLCLLHRDLRASLDDFLSRGERKTGLWQSQQDALAVDFPDAAAFRNLNSAADLTTAAR